MRYEIRDDFLFVDGEQVPYVPSPNRSGRMNARSIVVHDTAGPSAVSAVNWFSRRNAKVSAHFVIDEDGNITQCVPCDWAAWHAGRSKWRGRNGLNRDSIGIELVSPGKLVRHGSVAKSWFGKSYPIADVTYAESKSHGKGYWLPYPAAQVNANARLITALRDAYPDVDEVLGHYMISPGRKIDPSPLFQFAPARSSLNKAPRVNLGPSAEAIAEAQTILGALGYGAGPADGIMGPRTESAIFSFQRQNKLMATGALDDATAAAIEQRETAKEMPLAVREMTTEKEIVAVSRIAKEGAGEKREGVVMLLGGASLAGASQVQEASNALSSVVTTWGWNAVILSAAAVCVYLGWRRYRKGLRIIWLRLTDHQTGRHVGGPVQ